MYTSAVSHFCSVVALHLKFTPQHLQEVTSSVIKLFAEVSTDWLKKKKGGRTPANGFKGTDHDTDSNSKNWLNLESCFIICCIPPLGQARCLMWIYLLTPDCCVLSTWGRLILVESTSCFINTGLLKSPGHLKKNIERLICHIPSLQYFYSLNCCWQLLWVLKKRLEYIHSWRLASTCDHNLLLSVQLCDYVT